MLKTAGATGLTFIDWIGHISRVCPHTMEGSIHEIPHRFDSGLTSLSSSAFAISPVRKKSRISSGRLATKHHNQNRIDGLNKALREVRANCSDGKLKAEHQQKIAKQREEITARQRDLKEAEQKGDADKISKRQRKLDEAQHELKTLESRDY
jgi:vacuolar-type H+-ATPase subunit I/STV1